VIYYTISKGVYDADTVSRSGLRKGCMRREEREMDGGRGD